MPQFKRPTRPRNPSGANVSAPDGVEPLGTVRRSQLISTFGIGAILDLEKGSFMPMGLEDWESVNRLPSLSIGEPRLEAMLDVNHFRLGPVQEPLPGTRQVKARSAAPAIRFPEWQECPKCHRIGMEGKPFELADDACRLTCNAHNGKVYTTPVRLVVACRRGHLSDFPWVWWAHRNRSEGICQQPVLKLLSHGKSASLGDLFVACQSCGSSRSLGDAFGTQALTGNKCDGFRPWLHDREHDCPEAIRALQRGASNIHFPVVCSALSIPPASEAVSQIIQESRMFLDSAPDIALPSMLQGIAHMYGVQVEQLQAAYRQIKMTQTGAVGLTEHLARVEEYAALSEFRDDPVIAGVVPQFKNEVFDPPASLSPFIDLIGASSRLREVRALAGFSRIEPYPVAAEKVREAIAEKRVSPLSKTLRNWLPAAEIRGEGIFIRFRTSAIDDWMNKNESLDARVALLEEKSKAMADRTGYVRTYLITPRLLVVHAFSHALIRQISVECGYSAAAIRERLYVAEKHGDHEAVNGVLIYTGSPDSEGSLGGLVRLASPELIEPIILRALQQASWCGSDPVCLETDPRQSGERVSGSACHCCLLLPETACEKYNRELDRTMLVGDAVGSFKGYFDGLTGGIEWPS
jgi:hypothetical protein